MCVWEEKLLVRHTLDVMRSEKNLSENMLKTIFGKKLKWLSGRIWRRREFGSNSGCNTFLRGASKFPLHSMY
jgi:hypothetical protein